jgi:hypothetical protein
LDQQPTFVSEGYRARLQETERKSETERDWLGKAA